MASVSGFYAAPSKEFLQTCQKKQLLQIVKHYGINVSGKGSKQEISNAIVTALIKKGVLGEGELQSGFSVNSKPELFSTPFDGLTFEQRKELMLLQFEQEQMRMKAEAEKEIELERVRQETEKMKLELQQYKLHLIRDGKINDAPSGDQSFSTCSGSSSSLDLSSCLRLMPQFNEKDPDTFFILFERIADAKDWPDADRALLLQSVLTGRAQEAYSALSEIDCLDYAKVKAAVLKSYELVPEAYRQKFRNWVKNERQTHVEFARELMGHFNRWCSALGVDTFDSLSELMVLEQFKNCLPQRVATYVNEQKPKTVHKAAELADDFVLTHKGAIGEIFPPRFRPENSRQSPSFGTQSRPNPSKSEASRCNYCQVSGHWKSQCPVLKTKSRRRTFLPAVPALSCSSEKSMEVVDKDFAPFIHDAHVSVVGSEQRVPIKLLRDTGAKHSFIVSSVLPFSAATETGDFVLMHGMELGVIPVPRHTIMLECKFVRGPVVVGVRPALPLSGVSLILGNDLVGSTVWPISPLPVVTTEPRSSSPLDGELSSEVFPVCVMTRGQLQRAAVGSDTPKEDSVQLPEFPASVSWEEWVKAQKADPSLSDLFEHVFPGDDVQSVAHGYLVQNELLVRKWVPCNGDVIGEPTYQVVVPEKFRGEVLKIAHDDCGHLGVKKTYDRVLQHFFWPRLKRDVSKYIKSCHVCQLTAKPNQHIKPAPLCPIPAISKPFEHLIIDCVGPLPPSKSGCSYLLTVMCQTTRYPAAYPLRTITARSVVKALSQFISIFGIPRIIQSDQGTNFTSRLFAQVLKHLKVRHSLSSAYHAQSQGVLERFHQTLKSLLRAYCTEMRGDWEEGLPWLLLSAREVVQESTGFSPNDLVFGHTVRGPLAVLKDGLVDSDPPRNIIDYVNGFRHRLYTAVEKAHENLECAQSKMKKRYDLKAERREFSPGDLVLALTPLVSSPFQAKFSGPYVVESKISELNYIIATPNRRKSSRMCHVNLLKPYYSRGEPVPENSVAGVALTVHSLSSGPQSSVHGGEEVDVWADEPVLSGRLKNSETLGNLQSLFNHLSPEQCAELSAVIGSYPELFKDTPSRTHLIEHDIDVGDSSPIKQRFYRCAPPKLKIMEVEVQYMMDNQIAVPSSSSWASPSLLVEKSDKSPRFCTDYRKVNKVTKSDSYPLPRMEDCLDQVGSAKFVSKFDLLKGYWQVPLSARAREISAFITPFGLFEYTVMSFGLRNAPATFQRLMNMVVSGLAGCAVYLDDVVVFSDTWDTHVARICALFDRLSSARLTVNLAKCEFARATVTYLGRVVGQGQVRPVDAKVQAILQYPPPTTKKELMRFLGLVGYYRSFCPNFSTVVTPLTNLLKRDARFDWSTVCQSAFKNVKALLCATPVLAAPKMDQAFKIHVDASHVGAGAVLLQEENGIDKPVCYFSKKFNAYQLNYSTIEKETLALILALQHFEVYVSCGNGPVTIYTDHNPLTFLTTLKSPNQRLIRWALFLQAFSLDIRHIKGRDNLLADALSRAPM